MMKRVKDVLGVFLLVAGVGGIFAGIRGVSGDSWWGGPFLGAGVVANALAYRTMRQTAPKRTEEVTENDRATPSA